MLYSKKKLWHQKADIKKLTSWGQVREAGKEDTHHLEGSNIQKCGWESVRKGMGNEEIEELIAILKIKKLMQPPSKTYQYCKSEHTVPYVDKNLHGFNFVIIQKFLFHVDLILLLEGFYK